MARVHLDVNVFGEKWFSEVLAELLKTNSVRFSYAASEKHKSEHERVLKAKQFYKIVGDLKRRDDADTNSVSKRISFLEGLQEWKDEKDCDDPHIFALVYEKPTPYVFSTDADMANCRKCINKSVDSRYCRFIVISSAETYKSHKHKILR